MARPWQPQGNCHPFKDATVERIVPAVSGVYGLHTRRRQLFIGEAADLRETLLLHRKEAAKLFAGRQPSYFSFEVCEAVQRASRVQSLSAEYRPSIQALQPLSLAARPQTSSKRKLTEDDASTDNLSTPTPQWPRIPATHEAGASRQPSYFSRRQLAILGLSFVITAAVAGICGFIAGQKIVEGRQTALQLASARRPVLAYMASEASHSEPESAVLTADTGPVAGEPLPERAAAVAPLEVVSAAAHDGEAPVAKARKQLEGSALKLTRPDAADTKPPNDTAAKKELSAHPWSVQISATQDRTAALRLEEKLKSKGFDAFIVEAEIDSGRWHRVRVGRFSSSQEAEKTRQDLQSKENLANAFVTGK